MGASLNYFYVCADQEELLVFLMNFFITQVQATEVVLSDYDCQFSCMVKKSQKAENGIRLIVSIYQDQDHENTLVVDFKKKSGSSFSYYSFAKKIKGKLQKLVSDFGKSEWRKVLH